MLNKRCKSYTFAEYRALTNKEYSFVEKAIDHIKRNKKLYSRLVLTTALMIHFNMNFVFASNISNSLDATFGQLISLLTDFAKWGCLGLGLKKTIEEMLAGANFKQASTSGIQYWLAYIFIQFYPKLFDMIRL
jgi:hypothetical protein